jgi:HSP20 family protein
LAKKEEPKPEKRSRRRKSESPLERKAWGHDPLLGLESIKTTMSGMLSDLFTRRGAADMPYEPPIDLYQEEDALVLLVVLPGVHKDEIQMHAYQSLVIISGEFHPLPGVEESRYHFHERRIGPFHRSVPLPFPIRPEAIKASLRDGLLKVVLPLEGKAPGRSVQIAID